MKSETTDTVPEEPTADVCASKEKTERSNEQSDKFNQLLGIVQKQSEQIETLTKIVNTKQQSTNYNRFKVNCLVDTRSTVTTVTESFYNRFLRRCTDLQTDITFNLKGANGTCIPYIGYVEVDVLHYGPTFAKQSVLIVKDPIDSYTRMRKENVPGLLGMNVISLCNKLFARRLWSVNIGDDDIWLAPRTKVGILLKGDVENHDKGHVEFIRTGHTEEMYIHDIAYCAETDVNLSR
ncbi:unnamed protein product [Mytilus edulis]|uniref:Uncharacterized protein n=1 Tax=Mytilus edulis TaxID=6550 RepID=A0A8S3VPZ4_MYTED|nr:unnamed protein product [Mytilus edulis]